MMQKEDLFNYVMNSPQNTNPAVLKSIIEAVYSESGGSDIPYNDVVITSTSNDEIPVSGNFIIDDAYRGNVSVQNETLNAKLLNLYNGEAGYVITFDISVRGLSPTDKYDVSVNGTPIPASTPPVGRGVWYTFGVGAETPISGNTYNVVITDKGN